MRDIEVLTAAIENGGSVRLKIGDDYEVVTTTERLQDAYTLAGAQTPDEATAVLEAAAAKAKVAKKPDSEQVPAPENT